VAEEAEVVVVASSAAHVRLAAAAAVEEVVISNAAPLHLNVRLLNKIMMTSAMAPSPTVLMMMRSRFDSSLACHPHTPMGQQNHDDKQNPQRANAARKAQA